MQDAIPAEPEDAIPDEFRVPEPEPVIATCGADKSEVIWSSLLLVFVAAYPPTHLILALLDDHPLRAAAWGVAVCLYGHSFYSLGWRQPYRVELTRTTLRWRSLFRRVEVPLLSVRRVHLAWSRNKAKKLVVDGRGTRTVDLALHQLQDIDPFLAMLVTAAPGIEVRVSPLSVQRRL